MKRCWNKIRIAIVFAMFNAPLANALDPPITAVAFAPDAKFVATTSQRGLQLFSWPELRLQKTIKVSSANLHCLAFSSSGKFLAVGGGNPSELGAVEIFSWPNAKLMKTIHEHDDSVMSIAWLDDSSLFSASLDRQIRLSDVQQGETIRSYPGHSRDVLSLCLLNDQETFVSAGTDQSIRVWNSATGKLVRNLSQHTKPIRNVALRPSSESLPMVASAAEDGTVRFWQPTIGRMVRYVRLPSNPLNIAWSVDGKRVIAACEDGRARVIDPLEVKVTQDLAAIDGWAYAIAAHPTDSTFAVGGAGGVIRRLQVFGASKSDPAKR